MKGFGEQHKSKNKSIKKSKLSKEQIINQAFKLHSQGKVLEASEYYQYFIDQGFKDHRIFSNYGQILQNLGNLQDAEILTRKAIALDPENAMSHSNLGGILKNLCKLHDAEISTRKAIALDPNFAMAQLNLGSILIDLGKLNDAEISTRKAIALDPNFAMAQSNLGNILIDLGKVKELILLSNSRFKLRSNNQGDTLEASIQLMIANLLQRNFSATLMNINQTNKLLSQGAINNINNEKKRNHLSTFASFINSLYPLLEKKDKNPNIETIPHFGESHCLSFAHQTLSLSSELTQIQPVLITGGKAWHFANKKTNKWKDSLTQQMKNHNYSNKVFISFGEIDCRKDEGILKYVTTKDNDISKVCEETIYGYLNHMEITLSQNYSKRYYFGIPAPQKPKELIDKLDIKRIDMLKIYNSLLKKEVLARGCYFLDVYELTSRKDGMNNNIHMCDDTHLSPKCLSILFENHLYKPQNFIQ